MAKKVLTDHQKRVLSWINDGCPDNDWEPSYYKTSARMLAGYDLVKITGHGSTWTATITDRGTKVLAGTEPLIHARKKTGAPAPIIIPRSTREPTPASPKPNHDADEMARLTQELFQRLLDAEFHVVANLPTTRGQDNSDVDWDTVATRLRERTDLLSTTWKLSILTSYRNTIDVMLYPAQNWMTTPPNDIVPAARIGRYHPQVEAVMAYSTNITPALQKRARRLLHSLFTEVEARGWTFRTLTVADRKELQSQRSGEDQDRGRGVLICDGDHDYVVEIFEQHDIVEPPPTKKESEEFYQWSWNQDRKMRKFYAHPLNGRLAMTIGGHRLNDTPAGRARIETSLAKTLSQIARDNYWNEYHTEIKRRKRVLWEKKLELARGRADIIHRNHTLRDVLVERAEEWETYRKVQQYLADLEAYAAVSELGESGREWLEWCREHGQDRNPFHHLDMPEVHPQYGYERQNLVNAIAHRISDHEVS